MKDVQVSLQHAGVPDHERNERVRALQPAHTRLVHVIRAHDLAVPEASLALPSDSETLERCFALARRFAEYDLLVIIGIGGANLGSMAVHHAVQGMWHNAVRGPRVFFLDTVDAPRTALIVELTEAYLRANKRVLVNIISKSGATTETIANAELILELLRAYRGEAGEDVIVTTTTGSALAAFAQQRGYTILTVPPSVGDRYAVCSAEGIFPLACMGIDARSFLSGAQHALERYQKQPDALGGLAAVRHYHASHSAGIQDLFLFGSDLETLGKWWRQLTAESLGKQGTGITPTVSVGTTDLHSVAQLYLDGPRDKLVTFVTVAHEKDVTLPKHKEYDALVPHLQSKSLHTIMRAVEEGVAHAFREAARPFITLTLPDRSAYALGVFMQERMIETMLLAHLFGVNAFDQPAVESYKAATRARLS